jgi:hypothetical protein
MFYRIFFLLNLFFLLVACSQAEPEPVAVATVTPTATILPTNTAVPPTATFTPTPQPTATTTPAATATPMPTPTIANVYARGAHIITAGWSPGGQWLAYWLSDQADMEGLEPYDWPGGRLYLLDTSGSRNCELPQFRTTAGGQISVAWAAESSLTVRDWEANQQWQGRPCQTESFLLLSQQPVPTPTPDFYSGWSPDGRFRIHTELEAEDDERWTFLTVLRDQEGREITAVSWQAYPGPGHTTGGDWLTPTQFFLSYALDGALLLDANRPGEVINVPVDLLGIEAPEEHGGLIGRAGPEADSFYLLLRPGRYSSYFFLYHGHSGQVERLPYRPPSLPYISPDNQWLLDWGERVLDPGESNNLWLRPTAAVEGEWRLLAEEVHGHLFNDDLTELLLTRYEQRGTDPSDGDLVFTWLTFPDGDLIGEWPITPFTSRSMSWSPNGRFVAIVGFNEMAQRHDQALFLFERPRQ